MNKFEIEGNLVRDVMLKKSEKTSVALFTVAVARENAKGVDYLSLKAFGPLAESAGQALKQGCHVTVEGRIAASSYEKGGKKFYSQDLVAEHIKKDPTAGAVVVEEKVG